MIRVSRQITLPINSDRRRFDRRTTSVSPAHSEYSVFYIQGGWTADFLSGKSKIRTLAKYRLVVYTRRWTTRFCDKIVLLKITISCSFKRHDPIPTGQLKRLLIYGQLTLKNGLSYRKKKKNKNYKTERKKKPFVHGSTHLTYHLNKQKKKTTKKRRHSLATSWSPDLKAYAFCIPM